MPLSLARPRRLAAAAAAGLGLAALAATLPAMAAPPPATRPIVLVNCRHHGIVRPNSFVLTCADGNDYLAGLQWASWGHVAFAEGTEHVNNCVPSCVRGHFHRYRVLITAWRPAGHGQRHFTRLTELYPGRRPVRYTARGRPYRPLTVTWPL